ncbi:MAG: ATP-grasp domain-containing protein [Spirochaetales bacterium]|nr:ATP-grasp domain-containing protein [Spirochaetales bacterium]
MSLTRVLKDTDRIAIVNRGEAALRFIRAVREYNILHSTALQTVALYMDMEESAPFVRQSDDQVKLSSLPLYPGKQKSPYLDHELMLSAIKAADCQAIWVGWGFVSEDSVFAKKIEDADILFLGPSAQAMELLGDKIIAKELAEKSDVPILPWSKRSVDSVEDARQVAESIGYPVIVKAANAGGGRGIRFVRTPAELETQYKSARDETLRITGNTVVFIEHLVESGRHLEVQVLADRHGNVNTFGVRDCSVQRKNQKIIEETPPPNMDEKTIQAMEEAAARLIRAAKYESAGTVEYLFDLDANTFYFMEVNTRLQVEHPITETLYGIDLVKGQIDVARNLPVDLTTRTPRGHVIEVRLNAEDPDMEFSPAPGLVTLLKAPAGPGIRVDSGIEQGSLIPSEFDSMVAKIISHGNDRKEAISRLSRALRELRIRILNGTTNRAFLLELLALPPIIEGGVSTGFVEKLLKTRSVVLDQEILKAGLLAGAVYQYQQMFQEEFINFREKISRIGRPRISPKAEGYPVTLNAAGNGYEFLVRHLGEDLYFIDTGNGTLCCRYIPEGDEGVLEYNNKRYGILMVPRGDVLQCEVEGVPVMLESEAGGYVKSPSPAIVLSVSVSPGAVVKKGDVLVVLEAMKMEMLVESPGDGTVTEICVSAGTQVAAGAPLVSLDLGEAGPEEEEPKQEPVQFEPESRTPDAAFRMLETEFQGLFLGYDQNRKGALILKDFTSAAGKAKNGPELLAAGLLRVCEIYTAVEQLFIPKAVESEIFSRPVSYEELLLHYFRRFEDREKGLPEEFLDSLKKAFSCYCSEEAADDQIQNALFHIFRSHSKLAEKQEVLRNLFFTLETLEIHAELRQKIDEVVEHIARLTQGSAPSVADAARHARYALVDIHRIQDIRKDEHSAIDKLLQHIGSTGIDADLLAKVENSGRYIIRPLLDRSLEKCGKPEGDTALEILARRFNRDRQIISTELLHAKGCPVYCVETPDGMSVYTVCSAEVFAKAKKIPDLLGGEIPEGTNEIILLVKSTGARNSETEKPGFDPDSFNGTLWTGWYYKDGDNFFRSFTPQNSSWQENPSSAGFDPLQYRELRVHRLANFDLKILYRSEAVTLLEASCKINPKDKRLFALASASESSPELSEDEDITRMVIFEAAFFEAVSALQAAQARYRFRLAWNRIIMHNRSLLGLKLAQMKEYGLNFVHRVANLGIEKIVVYSLRKRWREENVRELELLFLNVNEDQFTLRSRTPSTALLKPLDAYVEKVVNARQRGNVYPYELVKTITGAGLPLNDVAYKGEFEEYDIEIKGPASAAVSVKDREPGKNVSNIVFGIIANQDPDFAEPFRRVLILSDPTKDFGSLAEEECRRINAALDLAQAKELPVEWIAISSGARIDMESGTENLDWTAATLRRIIEFTQNGGEINIIIPGVNVGAQSYWDAEATMLMHTRGLLIMTDDASMLLTGKRALEFAGSVSGESNLDIGGAEKIMGPNGQCQLRAANISQAYKLLFAHYRMAYRVPGRAFPEKCKTADDKKRDVTKSAYSDFLGQGFQTIGDIFSSDKNGERKKPFDMRQVMAAIIDQDAGYFERWRNMKDADTAIVWETRLGGNAVGMIGIESRTIPRIGSIPFDGPENWNGGTLFPKSSKKVARGINAFSARLPLVIVANLSGFDGSPESMRALQLEYGAEIGRAVVNFKGPIVFLVVARYHGGAYVVFSKSLNPNFKSAALEGSFASVIGGAPAAAVVFPKQVAKDTANDPRISDAQKSVGEGRMTQKDYDDLYKKVFAEKQTELGQKFDKIHSVERARSVGSIDDIIKASEIRPYLIKSVEEGMKKFG